MTKHTIEALQFAATVRQLAVAKRNAQINLDMTDAEAAAIKAKPIEPFIKAALDELAWMADVIARHRSQLG